MITKDLLLRWVVPAWVLAVGAGFLSPIAWATGAAYGVALVLLTGWGLRRSDRPAFGPADWITFARAVLVGSAAELIADGGRPVWVLAVVVAVALAMDGFDGQVARRT